VRARRALQRDALRRERHRRRGCVFEGQCQRLGGAERRGAERPHLVVHVQPERRDEEPRVVASLGVTVYLTAAAPPIEQR
jgi:hypothetical protein